MIQQRRPDDSESEEDPPGLDHCALLDEYWDALRAESGLDPRRLIDPDLADKSIAGDLEVLNLLHQVRCAVHADGGASQLPTAWLSESFARAASSREKPTATEPPPQPANDPKVPERIGKYQVVEMLDQGGQAQVFRVIHPKLAKFCALKLARRLLTNADQPDRNPLEAEGRILIDCEHPNLIRVIDMDVHEGRPFVVMEYVRGLTLQQFVAQVRPGPRQAARIVIELARAVAYLHDRGIIHQDIKPQNVLIDDQGRPRLIDLGMARQNHAWRDDADDSTGGTAGYMSPEQATGCADLIGPWTDVFGLGGLYYHLLTGRPVYVASSRAATYRMARKVDYRPVRQINPRVSRSLERICHKALAADPERRYPTAGDLERALRRSLERPRIAASCLFVLLLLTALVFVTRPGPPVAPKIVSLEVNHFRGDPAVPLGQIGSNEQTVRFDDDVRISVKLDAPAYCYVFALTADRKVQLCDPEPSEPPRPSEPPERKKWIRVPSGATTYFGLNDGLGEQTFEQAFVIVATTRPLPSFEKWSGSDGIKKRWKPTAADGVWSYDGHWIKRVDSVPRGEPRDHTGHPPGFLEVCEYLKNRPDVEAIQGIAFPVKPKGEVPTLRQGMAQATRVRLQREWWKPMNHPVSRNGRPARGLRAAVVGPVLAILIPAVLARAPKSGEAEPAPKPPWQRLLQGDDAKRAKDLDKAIETALKADQWDKAIARAEELVDLRSRVQGPKHDETATDEWRLKALRRVASMSRDDRSAYQSAIDMNQRAEALINQGKYAEAQLPCAKALEIRQRLFADDSPSTAESECNLATTLSAQGKYAQADERHERALKIDRRLFGGDHTQIAAICNNLAANLDAWGKFFEARRHYEEALRISQSILGDDNILTVTCYRNLAANLSAQKKYAEAQPLAKKALEINRRLFTDDHTSTALSYSYLAYNLTAQGKYDEAQPLCEKALEIFRRHLTENHNRTSECYTLLAIILDSQGKYDEARDRLRSAVKSQTAARLQVAFTGLERAGALRSPGAALAAIEARLKDPAAAWQALEEDLGRGLLDELAARDHGLPVGRVADLGAIQAALPADTALIAWVDIPPTGPNAHDPDGEHWGVVVRSRGVPSWVPITGTGPDGLWTEDDAALVYRVRTELQRRPEDGRANPGPLIEKFRTQRLTPLAEALGDTANGLLTVQRLIVLPSRGMMGIPIEALLANDDPRTVSYAPSATVFKYLRDQPKPDPDAGLLALGDPNFAVARAGELGFDPLPSSRAEVAAIAQLFRSRDRDADCLRGRDASEPKLHGLAISGKLGQFGVIHLATHAVIDEDIPARSAVILTQPGLPDPPRQDDNNKPGFDGRVSVSEIQLGWHLKAELVTLSACDTALGRDAGGEGFVGFTQALLLSGARSVCLSLWKVDDRATSLLMTRFYQNWLGARPGRTRMPKAEALREAKQWLRGSTREEATHAMEQISRGSVRNKAMAPAIPPPAHPYEHPYYWAGFILVGDPD